MRLPRHFEILDSTSCATGSRNVSHRSCHPAHQRRRIGQIRGPVTQLARSQQQASEDQASFIQKDDAEDNEKFSTASGLVEAVEESLAEVDFLGESTEGNLHLVSRASQRSSTEVLGLSRPSDILNVPIEQLQSAQEDFLEQMAIRSPYPHGQRHRAIFCNRTMNLRSIQAVGYDMDYTLIHYDVNMWEGKAYSYGLQYLREVGCPVEGLRFDPDLVIRGLIIDKERGNLLKVDRFGYVKRAMHGTKMMTWQELREGYGRELVNLKNEGRYYFLNTLFSVSEGVMYMQMVDRMDQGAIPLSVVTNSYDALYKLVSRALYRTHVEGKLKAEIIKDPSKYVELDPDMAQSLVDMRQAGKILMLITNSDFEYTEALHVFSIAFTTDSFEIRWNADKMMSYAYNRFVPSGQTWRSLFDMVIVQARKPDFFNNNMSLYEVVTDDGLMRPAMTARKGGLYCGGSAKMVERALGVEGDDVLYVGDHIYTDAALAKINLRWRTALIVRELEEEILALQKGRIERARLKELMHKKELVGDIFNNLRLTRQRYFTSQTSGGGSNGADAEQALQRVNDTLAQLLMVMEKLDSVIGPLLQKDGEHFNKHWGHLSRAGLNDESQFTRQVCKYSDVYTSRVANFVRSTPYAYFRSPSMSLVHDQGEC